MKRLYVVTDGENEWVVEAQTQAQAVHLIVAGKYTARPATAYDTVRIYGNEIDRTAQQGAKHG